MITDHAYEYDQNNDDHDNMTMWKAAPHPIKILSMIMMMMSTMIMFINMIDMMIAWMMITMIMIMIIMTRWPMYEVFPPLARIVFGNVGSKQERDLHWPSNNDVKCTWPRAKSSLLNLIWLSDLISWIISYCQGEWGKVDLLVCASRCCSTSPYD